MDLERTPAYGNGPSHFVAPPRASCLSPTAKTNQEARPWPCTLQGLIGILSFETADKVDLVEFVFLSGFQ